GVTFPSIDVAVLDAGHDVFDEAALVQIAGRAGRSAQDTTGEIVYIHDGKNDATAEAVRMITLMNRRGRGIVSLIVFGVIKTSSRKLTGQMYFLPHGDLYYAGNVDKR